MANEHGRRHQQERLADQQQAEIDETEVNSLRRSGSASPSTFSTASSGSPLVRNLSSSSSGCSGGPKRPPPTSIAAAQLQCQQQQQIEFANQLAASGKKSSLGAKQSGGRSSKKAPNSLYSVEQQPQPQPQKKSSKRGGDSNGGELSKSQSYGDDSHNTNNKGFGYNLAKSIAFKAYSFTEFKSNSKLRYMNLACLLLTLVCLVTILIFSGNNSGAGGGGDTAAGTGRSHLYWRQQQQQAAAATRKSLLLTSGDGNKANDSPMPTGDDNDEDETSESIDSLNSQPLFAHSSSHDSLDQTDPPALSSSQHQQKPGADLEREFILSAEFERVPNVIDELGSAPGGAQQAAATTTLPPAEQQKSSPAEPNSTASAVSSHSDSKDTANRTENEQPGSVNGLFNDPFLNSTFTKSELRTLSKLLKRSHGKPVSLKGKSGATITMRSSSNFDGSQLSSIPSFIEKQLQLGGFKPAASFISGSEDSAAAAAAAAANRHQPATSTSNLGAMEAPNFVSTVRSGSFAALPPIRMLHHQQQPAELLMPEPISMVMAPMLEQMFRPSPLAMPSTLMRMIMRADGPSLLDERLADDAEQQQPSPSDDLTQATLSRTVIFPQASLTILAGGLDSANSNASNTNEDTLASQQKNSTATNPQQQRHASGKLESHSSVASPASASASSFSSSHSSSPPPSKQAANNSEVETFDVSQLAKSGPVESSGRLQSFYPARPRGSAASFLHSLPRSSSMIIFGPGESGEQSRRPDHSPFHLSPFGQGGLLPFMAPPFVMQPQIMMFGAGSPADGLLDNQPQENPLYPILGSILNNVMADFSSLAHNKEERSKGSTVNNNKTTTAPAENSSRAQQQQSARNQLLGSSLAPNWTATRSPGADIGSKSSNMNNNLFAGSNNEEWSPGAGDSDSWDEHAQLQPAVSAGKQLKARQREANSGDVGLDLDSSGADASDIAGMTAGATNSRLFPSPGSVSLFGASMLGLPAGIVSGSIRQTIRGPGMTVQRTIELPAARAASPAAVTASTSGPKAVAQQVGEAIRSQSLRRTDGGDSDSSADSMSSSSSPMANMIGRHHRPIFSPLGSMLARHVNDRSAAGDNGDEFPPFPMAPVSHALGRILNDLAQQQSRGAERISIARSSPMPTDDSSDDLEEGDSSPANGDDVFASLPTAHRLHHEGPPNGAHVRVASARFIIRPVDSAAHEGGLVVPPLRFTTQDTGARNANLERELPASPSGSQEATERMMVVAPSFEDTLNSMEDRVNQVLSLSAQQMNSAAPSMRPSAASKPGLETHDNGMLSGKAPLMPRAAVQEARVIPPHAPNANAISRSDLAARLESSLPNQQASGLASINGNPFTSPSSPLFGFPTSSITSLLGDHQKQQAEESSGRHNSNNNKPNEKTPTGSFRQRKSFTYHSNNEPAGANQQKQQQAELAMEDSNQQSAFAPFDQTPVALPSMIFGRRMDDIPEQFRVPQHADVFFHRRNLELEAMS